MRHNAYGMSLRRPADASPTNRTGRAMAAGDPAGAWSCPVSVRRGVSKPTPPGERTHCVRVRNEIIVVAQIIEVETDRAGAPAPLDLLVVQQPLDRGHHRTGPRIFARQQQRVCGPRGLLNRAAGHAYGHGARPSSGARSTPPRAPRGGARRPRSSAYWSNARTTCAVTPAHGRSLRIDELRTHSDHEPSRFCRIFNQRRPAAIAGCSLSSPSSPRTDSTTAVSSDSGHPEGTFHDQPPAGMPNGRNGSFHWVFSSHSLVGSSRLSAETSASSAKAKIAYAVTEISRSRSTAQEPSSRWVWRRYDSELFCMSSPTPAALSPM